MIDRALFEREFLRDLSLRCGYRFRRRLLLYWNGSLLLQTHRRHKILLVSRVWLRQFCFWGLRRLRCWLLKVVWGHLLLRERISWIITFGKRHLLFVKIFLRRLFRSNIRRFYRHECGLIFLRLLSSNMGVTLCITRIYHWELQLILPSWIYLTFVIWITSPIES